MLLAIHKSQESQTHLKCIWCPPPLETCLRSPLLTHKSTLTSSSWNIKAVDLVFPWLLFSSMANILEAVLLLSISDVCQAVINKITFSNCYTAFIVSPAHSDAFGPGLGDDGGSYKLFETYFVITARNVLNEITTGGATFEVTSDQVASFDITDNLDGTYTVLTSQSFYLKNEMLTLYI